MTGFKCYSLKFVHKRAFHKISKNFKNVEDAESYANYLHTLEGYNDKDFIISEIVINDVKTVKGVDVHE